MTSQLNNDNTYNNFLAYRAAVMQAIALAWKDDGKFLHDLEKNPVAALKEHIGYDYPFAARLEVTKDSAVWRSEPRGDWVTLERSLLEMVLPPCPEDPQDHVEALAAFNAKHLTFMTR